MRTVPVPLMPRISNSDSPIPGGGDDYTQQQGEVKKQPNIDELKKKMEQARLKKLRGDLDQLIEADPKLFFTSSMLGCFFPPPCCGV